MTTTMVVQTNHDIERAVLPIDLSQRQGLPISVLIFLNRMVQSIRSFNSSLTLLRVIKISVGALVGTLSLWSAWWALDLAMWTSVKDFREDCREQLSNFNITSPVCLKALSRPLREPPTWRGYLEKATLNFPWDDGGYRFIRDKESQRRQLASRAARPDPTFHDDLSGFFGSLGKPGSQDELSFYERVAGEGIRRQGDAAIMYGGMESYLTVEFPLDEAEQEDLDYLWEYLQEESLCNVWLNTTVKGTVQEFQPVLIPDQRDKSHEFDEVLVLMPLDLREERHRLCEYPSPPYPGYVNSRNRTMADMFHAMEVILGPGLALTFFLVIMGHEVMYGGFAKKTRWKWQ